MNSTEKAPVILFVYNRADHTKQTLEALNRNIDVSEYNLFIFSDGPKPGAEDDVAGVRKVLSEFEEHNDFQKVTIFESEKNNGLANSVIEGVSKLIAEYEKVIVLEDDLITSQDFLRYMSDALAFYEKNAEIWSIAGYSPVMKRVVKKYPHDIYMCLRAGSWGWATWKDRWEKVDWTVSDYLDFSQDKGLRRAFDKRGPGMSKMLEMQMNGLIDSWAIRWCYQQFKDNALTVNPCKSKVKNIGVDGSGTHRQIFSRKWNVELENSILPVRFENLNEEKWITREYNRYFFNPMPDGVKRILKRLWKLIIKNKE